MHILIHAFNYILHEKNACVKTCIFKIAGAEGVEPSSAVLETGVKPFNYAPKYTYRQRMI